jgi:hypothetical protein
VTLLWVRGAFGIGFIGLGCLVLARLLPFAPKAGLQVAPGIVLGLAMIALGVHRMLLIRRILRSGSQS